MRRSGPGSSKTGKFNSAHYDRIFVTTQVMKAKIKNQFYTEARPEVGAPKRGTEETRIKAIKPLG